MHKICEICIFSHISVSLCIFSHIRYCHISGFLLFFISYIFYAYSPDSRLIRYLCAYFGPFLYAYLPGSNDIVLVVGF